MFEALILVSGADFDRWESGIESPRIGVCALNPHNGENGSFGRQEIDAIAPAVKAAQDKGINVQGPFPCDTIFLKRAHFDGIVTMYHDQGQIALKLLSFEGGVTIQGGLPMIIATPAHGTAFDIVGKGIASVASTQAAFDVAVTMASRRLQSQKAEKAMELSYTASLAAKVEAKAVASVSVIEVASCC
jgi:4-hydroxythreonine-4-phosphate dehydrogenase